jgi:ABC-type xylose transport system substrate-binding protein
MKPNVDKKVKHMGMTMTEEEHEKWHKEQHEMTPQQHEALMKKMSISKEEDKEWHKKHSVTKALRKQVQKLINPFAVGGGFLNYCVKQGWLVQRGKGRSAKYYVTEEGEAELRKFGIEV